MQLRGREIRKRKKKGNGVGEKEKGGWSYEEGRKVNGEGEGDE